jgi:1-acyl-sn-glycerol-3-phosphate acyltransferase
MSDGRVRAVDQGLIFLLCKKLCQGVCLTWFRFRAHHVDRLPSSGAFLLVANHQSYLDPVLAGIGVPRGVYFMARRSLFVGPLGWLIWRLGSFPVNRDRADLSSLREAINRLRRGNPVLIFPEGTRSHDGRLGVFRSGFGVIARRAGVPILPAYIDGSYRAWPRGRFVPRPAPILVVYGRPIAIGPDEDDRSVVRRVEAALRVLQGEAAVFRARAKG